MRVAETVAIHGFGALHFVDATSGITNDPSTLAGLDEYPVVEFDNPPKRLRQIQKRGTLALTFEEGVAMPANASRTIPVLDAPDTAPRLSLSGTVRGTTARWLPRRFSCKLDRGDHATIGLYPSPLGTVVGNGGALVARLGDDSGAGVPWAVLKLTVTVSASPLLTIVCTAQSDANGDVILPMRRLPQLPRALVAYAASLSVQFSLDAHAESPVDPSQLTVGKLVPTDSAVAVPSIALRVAPGTRQRIVSLNNPHGQLVVKP